ncbi:GNAT family N-acetyltransferase [Candidatus Xianfuyuplasma coldseepsis]|uniref:GNAT family N-acetyltransferase n=1 Tax=Candidatus Xianfuyuplasma coldseepsis TaxID=2782163 RepID=A0A7L7KS76_9MOLU|nr:GNAT family N-acetyltransferase [Xianfuyuplasma coldseepsis]QMS85269.1 GNAT family N-acetyltransferase [Xianfuyuplasma coldseepsis]
MKYSLRKASIEDKKCIYDLKKNSNYKYVDEIWGWDETYQINDFNDSFIIEELTVIENEGNVIGFYQLSVHPDKINLTEIHIKPEFRGRGIGSELINAFITGARNQRKRLTLGSFKSNTRATELYHRLGFTIFDETATHYMMEIK